MAADAASMEAALALKDFANPAAFVSPAFSAASGFSVDFAASALSSTLARFSGSADVALLADFSS